MGLKTAVFLVGVIDVYNSLALGDKARGGRFNLYGKMFIDR